jgi:hypothetical protein
VTLIGCCACEAFICSRSANAGPDISIEGDVKMRNVAFGRGEAACDRCFVTGSVTSLRDGRGRACFELQGGGSVAGGGLDIMSLDAAIRTAAPQGAQIEARLFR